MTLRIPHEHPAPFHLKRFFHSRQHVQWYLADLGEFRGKQALYTQQSPQRLKTLREHALIESAVSSNRIEGVSVDPSRVRDVLVAANGHGKLHL